MKIFLEITTPGNGKTYEFEVSDVMSVKKAKDRFIKDIMIFENGAISFAENSTLLCHLSKKTTLKDQQTLRDAGVRSGDNLILL